MMPRAADDDAGRVRHGAIKLAATSIATASKLARHWNQRVAREVSARHRNLGDDTMGFGRGVLLWLIGVPIPIIILLALFWHH